MDLFKAQLERISRQLSGLSASQKMLAGTLVAIMVMTLILWGRYAAEPEMRALMDRALEGFRRIPGVAAAGATTSMPLSGSASDSVILAEGYQMQPGESLVSPHNAAVTPGYCEAMGVGLVRGRYFDSSDTDKSQRVLIVDERLVKHFWPAGDPLGKRMRFPQDPRDLLKVDDKTVWMTIVGVVRTVNGVDVGGKGNPVGTYYLPYTQRSDRAYTFAIKTSTDPAALTGAARAEFGKAAPALPLFDIHTMTERTELSLAPRRASMTLALGFGGVALFLAAIGIYGVLAYLVTQRRRELGIRAALGCTVTGIVRLVVNEGLLLLGVGIVAGGAGAFALRRAIETEAYGVQPLDPTVITGVALALGMVALMACVLPARRAAGVDPVTILREE